MCLKESKIARMSEAKHKYLRFDSHTMLIKTSNSMLHTRCVNDRSEKIYISIPDEDLDFMESESLVIWVLCALN